jgi:hypothetical protein
LEEGRRDSQTERGTPAMGGSVLLRRGGGGRGTARFTDRGGADGGQLSVGVGGSRGGRGQFTTEQKEVLTTLDAVDVGDRVERDSHPEEEALPRRWNSVRGQHHSR